MKKIYRIWEYGISAFAHLMLIFSILAILVQTATAGKARGFWTPFEKGLGGFARGLRFVLN